MKHDQVEKQILSLLNKHQSSIQYSEIEPCFHKTGEIVVNLKEDGTAICTDSVAVNLELVFYPSSYPQVTKDLKECYKLLSKLKNRYGMGTFISLDNNRFYLNKGDMYG